MKTIDELDKIRTEKYFEYVTAEYEYQNMRKSIDPTYVIKRCGCYEDES